VIKILTGPQCPDGGRDKGPATDRVVDRGPEGRVDVRAAWPRERAVQDFTHGPLIPDHNSNDHAHRYTCLRVPTLRVLWKQRLKRHRRHKELTLSKVRCYTTRVLKELEGYVGSPR
jgi:hypothetical protein